MKYLLFLLSLLFPLLLAAQEETMDYPFESLQVYDVSGRMLYQQAIDAKVLSQTVATPRLPRLFVVALVGNGGRVSWKVVRPG
ncbi:MAG: hypothetical protein GVY26_13060 [Bacteroidetes bacterium]|jgi:hypothetical protein|nr:hypothetical protein [Bacteroidota bacterium]